MKLSLCIAAFNEEKNIHYPLDSAYDLVDEVILVDGGSRDKTVEIARSYGDKVKVFIEKNPEMFHINKQKAIEKAKGEWILQLDSDEALSDELKEEITQLIHRNFQFPISNFQINSKSKIQKSKQEIVAYWIPRKNWFLTRFLMKGGQYPDYTIRLYKNGYAKFPCKDVHENVEIIDQRTKSKEQKLEVGYLKSPILHYADPDFSRYLMRWDRYTTLEVQSSPSDSEGKVQNENKNQLLMFLEYFVWKPIYTFFSMYFRHLGFLDGFPGFVFALFSSIRFWVIYIKWKTLKNQRPKIKDQSHLI
jgi:glycosyltransferase involved in cell wall biosynthesis